MGRVVRHSPAAVGLIMAVLLAACTAPTLGDGGSAQALPQVAAGAKEKVPSALDDMRDDRFPPPLIDPGDILSGGPPPDGIPAIDKPTFQRAADVEWMADAEAVLALTIGGERVATRCRS